MPENIFKFPLALCFWGAYSFLCRQHPASHGKRADLWRARADHRRDARGKTPPGVPWPRRSYLTSPACEEGRQTQTQHRMAAYEFSWSGCTDHRSPPPVMARRVAKRLDDSRATRFKLRRKFPGIEEPAM